MSSEDSGEDRIPSYPPGRLDAGIARMDEGENAALLRKGILF